MKHFFLFLSIIWVAFCNRAESQNLPCVSDNNLRRHLASVKARLPKEITKEISEQTVEDVNKFEDTIFIPVVVHIVYYQTKTGHKGTEAGLTDDAIYEQIRILNEDYSGNNPRKERLTPLFRKSEGGDTKIRFNLVDIKRVPTKYSIFSYCDDEGESQSLCRLINIKSASSGSVFVPDHLNIWVGNLQSGVDGYATWPSTPIQFDGVVIDYRCFSSTSLNRYCKDTRNLGETLTHEVGHWLGLFHTFGTSCGRETSDCCNDEDFVEDTPRHRKLAFDCNSTAEVSCSDTVMYMNYMYYANDECMASFTKGQIIRMRSQFLPEGYRRGLYLSQLNPTQHSINIPVIKSLYNEDDGTLVIDMKDFTTSDTISSFLLSIKSLESNTAKSILVADPKAEKGALKIRSESDEVKVPNNYLTAFSNQGLTAFRAKGLKKNTVYLIEILPVSPAGLVHYGVRYTFLQRRDSPTVRGDLQIVVPN